MPKKIPGIAAGMITTKSKTFRPGQLTRCTRNPPTGAKTTQPTAAKPLYKNVFWSDVACAPRYSKCDVVKLRFVGNAKVSALATSVPYTRRITPESSRHATKNIRVNICGTGGRGIDEAR